MTDHANGGAYVAVVGGINIDICGQSFKPLIAEDSNPGRVSRSLGGVGRNIAHNLALMGVEVKMLTAYGDDDGGRQAEDSCAALGIDLSHALCVPGGSTPCYLCLSGPDGDMALAINDMELCERVSPEYLSSVLDVINGARAVVFDTNIPGSSVRFLVENCTAPLFCDPVSVAKAGKLLSLSGNIHTIKPNRREAELLTGIKIETPADAEAAAEALTGKGIKQAFISLGEHGTLAADANERLLLPNIPGAPVSMTGCGDAFLAAVVSAYLDGDGLRRSALKGLAAASIAMESPAAVNPAMSREAIVARLSRATV